jgi:hypothetical protein
VSNQSIVRATARLIKVAGISPATLQDPTPDSVLACDDLVLGFGSAVRVNDYMVNILLVYV